jgi:hypothetical protein
MIAGWGATDAREDALDHGILRIDAAPQTPDATEVAVGFDDGFAGHIALRIRDLWSVHNRSCCCLKRL